MHELSTPSTLEKASLSRRRFLAGAVALPAVVAVPAAMEAAEGSDQLAWLIDEWREIKAQEKATWSERTAILQRADQPKAVGVMISEVASNLDDYPAPDVELRSLGAINHIWGNTKIFRNEDDIGRRLHEDHERAIALFHDRLARRHAWREAVGYNALETKGDVLLKTAEEVEGRICRHPCSSWADVALKLEFVAEAFDAPDIYADRYVEILTSMREFVLRIGPSKLTNEAGAV